MPAIQTSYPEKMDAGRAGGIVNTEHRNLISRTVETAEVGFGVPVMRGSTDSTCAKFAPFNPVFLGITVRERSTDANNPDVFRVGDSARIMTKGNIYALTPGAVAAGDLVYIVDADATFHNTAAAGRTLVPNAVWDKTVTAAELSVIALGTR